MLVQKEPRYATPTHTHFIRQILAVGFIVFLIATTIWHGIMGMVIILILVCVVCTLILKAWEADKILFSSKLSPNHTIPSHQSSQQLPCSPSYEQGDQKHSSSESGRPYANAGLKDVSPWLHEEQPQAQYPEQMPPMRETLVNITEIRHKML